MAATGTYLCQRFTVEPCGAVLTEALCLLGLESSNTTVLWLGRSLRTVETWGYQKDVGVAKV